MYWELAALGIIAILFFLFLYVDNKDVKYAIIYIDDHKLKAEIVDTVFKKTRGLMGRDEIESDAMLFVNMFPYKSGIWMRNMKFPIDIIWVNNGKIIDIKQNAEPCKGICPVYYPKSSAKYVIEVPANWTKDNKINIGAEVKLPNNV